MNQRNAKKRDGRDGRSNSAQSAGLSVSALIAEIMTENGNCHSELAIERTCYSGNEADRCKNRDQNQRGGNHRPGDFAHRLLGSDMAIELGIFLKMAGDVFHHDDGIIDHQGDCQHNGEEVDGIGRIAKNIQNGKDANKRDRDGYSGDERRTPVLQKDKNDQNNKSERYC